MINPWFPADAAQLQFHHMVSQEYIRTWNAMMKNKMQLYSIDHY